MQAQGFFRVIHVLSPLYHLLGVKDFVEAFRCQKAQLHAGFLQADVFVEGKLRGFGCIFIADIGIQSRDQHEGVVQVLPHLLPVRPDADGTVYVEGADGLTEQPRRLQEVIGDDRQENVQFKVALRGSKTDGIVVACGDGDLPQPAAGPRGKPAHIVCDLHHIARQRSDRAVGKDQLVPGGERVELVLRGHKGLSGQCSNFSSSPFRKACRGVQSGSDRRAAEGQLVQRLQGETEHLAVPLQGCAPAADLLGKGDGHRVL